METVLGVSITATEVRAALVEGANADGVLIEQDVFDIAACDGSATPNTADQVTAVVLGTQQGALAAGHHLASTGVAWSDETDAAAVREALVARGLDDVLLVSELNAAAALAQAVGRTLAYDKTALMFVDRDTATLAVVESIDGSVAKILSQKRYGTDAVATLNEMIPSLRAEDPHPQGMFVVGSGVDVTAIKAHLTHVLSLPVIASEEPQIALARGAALASANTPRFDTSTIGLAYSQEAGETVVHPTALVDGTTDALHPDEVREGRKPFLLVGSTLAVFTVGITALAITMAVNVQPATEQNPGETACVRTNWCRPRRSRLLSRPRRRCPRRCPRPSRRPGTSFRPRRRPDRCLWVTWRPPRQRRRRQHRGPQHHRRLSSSGRCYRSLLFCCRPTFPSRCTGRLSKSRRYRRASAARGTATGTQRTLGARATVNRPPDIRPAATWSA